jgi:hypothetical protein
VNVERIMREAGMTDADIRHCCNLHQVCKVFGDEVVGDTVRKATVRAIERTERRVVRRFDPPALTSAVGAEAEILCSI